MLLVINCFGSGQMFLLSQLQLSVSVFCDWLFLIICALCLVIIDLTSFMQLLLTFKVFLLKILRSLCCSGKCLSIKLKNSRPIFVLTLLLNGGLNQIMLRCLFLRVRCDAS